MTEEIDRYRFGRKLKELRNLTSQQNSRDKSRTNLTQLSLASELTDVLGINYSESIVQKWESGTTPIAPRERKLLKTIIIILKKYGAITSYRQANELLLMGFHNPLTLEERIEIDPTWAPKKRGKSLEFDLEKYNITNLPLLGSDISSRRLMVPAPPPQGVIGREKAIANILKKFDEIREDETTEPAIALSGMGGIGKTSLAIKFAKNSVVREQFPQGVLWVSLGLKPCIRLRLNDLGSAIGLDLKPENNEESCTIRLRTELENRRFLIVVDDVWDSNAGKYFKVGGPGCRTLFTTREPQIANQLVSVSQVVGVDKLEPKDAFKLLAKLAPAVIEANPIHADKLCGVLQYYPLGLTLAGKMLANEADVPSRMLRLLGELIEHSEARLQLMEPEGHPNVDKDNPVSLQAILGISVERLSETDKRRFAKASMFGAEPIVWDIEEAAGTWRCTIPEAEETLSHFLQRGLIERRGTKYNMHALLVDYGKIMLKNYEE